MFSAIFIDKSKKSDVPVSQTLTQFISESIQWLNSYIKTGSPYTSSLDIQMNEAGDIYKCNSVDGKVSGSGIVIDKTNKITEGKFFNGFTTKGKVFIINHNREYYEGVVDDEGLKTDKGIYYYEDGEVYDGQFLNDMRVGKGKLQYPDGSQYIGQFINDQADGHGIFTDSENN